MNTGAIVLDGFLENATIPGDLHGSTARFRLTLSPTDERTDETVLPCTVTDPALAHAVLHDLAPGDKLRVTGHLHIPRTPDEPMRLAVTTLAVLDTAPPPHRPGPRRHGGAGALRPLPRLVRRRHPHRGRLHRDRNVGRLPDRTG
ncbi:hypothetical protein ACFV2V_16905 [Streptomyces sp. NPDC059698]|uniref:hypothetical protein n=1 Tax=unclassified Streptomyces TaxID=2593676 RepID=UPI001F5B4D3C|nr:hypothetical protein [Streptomyces sp. CB02366]